MEFFEPFLYVALCAAAISFTITTTSMFKWLRELVSPIHHKIEELIHCPWCLGHYIVFIMMLCSNFKEVYPFFDVLWMDILFTWFVIISIMGLILFVLLRAFEPVMKYMMNREMDKLREKE